MGVGREEPLYERSKVRLMPANALQHALRESGLPCFHGDRGRWSLLGGTNGRWSSARWEKTPNPQPLPRPAGTGSALWRTERVTAVITFEFITKGKNNERSHPVVRAVSLSRQRVTVPPVKAAQERTSGGHFTAARQQ